MNKLQRPYTYIAQLEVFEQVLFWGGNILVVLMLVGTLWLILNDKNPGDGSQYHWIFPIVFIIASFNIRLIIKGIKITESKRPLSEVEQTYLFTLQNSVSPSQKQPSALELMLHTLNKWLSIIFIAMIIIVLVFIFWGNK